MKAFCGISAIFALAVLNGSQALPQAIKVSDASKCVAGFGVCGKSRNSCCEGMACINTFFLGQRCVPLPADKTTTPKYELLGTNLVQEAECGHLTEECGSSKPCCGGNQCFNTYILGNRCFPSNHNDSMAILEKHLVNLYRSSANMPALVEQSSCVQVTHVCENSEQCCDNAQCLDTYLLGKRCIKMPSTNSLQVLKDEPVTYKPYNPPSKSDKCSKLSDKCDDHTSCCGPLECWKPIPMISRGRCMPKFIPLITRVLDQFNIQPVKSEDEFELLYISA